MANICLKYVCEWQKVLNPYEASIPPMHIFLCHTEEDNFRFECDKNFFWKNEINFHTCRPI